MSLTSGAADRGHRRPNTDPEPWAYMIVPGLRAPRQETGGFRYDPRPEYGPVDNPLLIVLRDMVHGGHETYDGFYGALHGGAFDHADPAHRRHASRVLVKLRALQADTTIDLSALPLLAVVKTRDGVRHVKITPNGWVRVNARNYQQITTTAVEKDNQLDARGAIILTGRPAARPDPLPPAASRAQQKVDALYDGWYPGAEG